MKSLWKFLNTREENLQFLLLKPKNVVTPVIFQKIAVEIEMLSVFYGLLKFSDSDFKRKKTFKPFRKLAKMVDEVASLQQEELLLNQLFDKTQLVVYKRDVRKLKELKREDYFSIVNENFVKGLSEKKSELEPILRKTGKKTVAEFLKKRKKKILKVLGKEELSDSKITELRTRLKEYNFLKTLNQKTKIKKDEFEQQLDAWNQKKQQISQIHILIESGVFEKKELVLIKKAEAQLTGEAAKLHSIVNETAPIYNL